MARFEFLHAADLSLDAPFTGIGRVPADVGRVLRDASVDAWSALVDLAVARDVAAVLLAGGLCDGLERGARAQARLRDGALRLTAHGIAVFVALGARDAAAGLAGADLWPSGVTVFDDGVRAARLERDGVQLATVHGIAALGPDATPLVRRVNAAAFAGPHLGLMHARLGEPNGDGSPCALCSETELRATGLDYWALGHAPRHAVVARVDPWIVYPGMTQARAMAPPEGAAGGAVLVEVEDGIIRQVSLEPLDRVRCLRIEHTDGTDLDGLRRGLDARAAALRALHAERALVLEAEIDGSPAVLRALRKPEAVAGLLRALRRDAARWDPFVWWAAVHPRGSAAPSLGGGDLANEIRRVRAELAADPARCGQFLAERFEPLRNAWTADLEQREAGELLDAAAALAIDTVEDVEAGA